MLKIGLISDTHGYWDERYVKYLGNCDEIWHAGDIGSLDIIDQLKAFKPLKIVSGNIDNNEIQQEILGFSYATKVRKTYSIEIFLINFCNLFSDDYCPV